MKPSTENARRVYDALAAFGAPLETFDVSQEDFAHYEGVLQIGVPPLRIDILTSVQGLSFAKALENHESLEVEGRPIPMIGSEALLVAKRAAGRPQDQADVLALEAACARSKR